MLLQYFGCFFVKLKKSIIVIITAISFMIVGLFLIETWTYKSKEHDYYASVVHQFYYRRRNWITSNLGSVLFKDVLYSDLYKQKPRGEIFMILIWKYNLLMKDPNLPNMNYSESKPFQHCVVKNCIISSDESNLNTADAVVVNLSEGSIPPIEGKKSYQRWIFWTQTTPSRILSHTLKVDSLVNVFNWSMSYMTKSDVPIPFGRTIPQPGPVLVNKNVTGNRFLGLIPYWKVKQTEVLISAMLYNCNNMKYIQDLAKYVQVDVFGNCSQRSTKKRKKRCSEPPDCLNEYLFTIVFEEESCVDYLTEKTFNAYALGAIPIIMGTSMSNCQRLLPVNSFIHYHYFSSPNGLAREVIETSKENDRLLDYHVWRNYFQVKNEHGFYDSNLEHYCRICEALNFNDPGEKVYGAEELYTYFEPRYSCVY